MISDSSSLLSLWTGDLMEDGESSPFSVLTVLCPSEDCPTATATVPCDCYDTLREVLCCLRPKATQI